MIRWMFKPSRRFFVTIVWYSAEGEVLLRQVIDICAHDAEDAVKRAHATRSRSPYWTRTIRTESIVPMRWLWGYSDIADAARNS